MDQSERSITHHMTELTNHRPPYSSEKIFKYDLVTEQWIEFTSLQGERYGIDQSENTVCILTHVTVLNNHRPWM